MFRYHSTNIYLIEIPDEISLGYYIAGCPKHCKNCHTPEVWDDDPNLDSYPVLTLDIIFDEIEKNHMLISNILFFGGDWNETLLRSYFRSIKETVNNNDLPEISTSLYTGKELSELEPATLQLLDYVKVGPYKEELGGLQSKTTNQRLYKLDRGEIEKDLTYLMRYSDD